MTCCLGPALAQPGACLPCHTSKWRQTAGLYSSNTQDIRPSVCMCRSGFEGVNNGMMAAAPGLPLWQSVVQILEDRAVPTGDKWKDAPIFQTGPNVLATVWRSAGLRD